jgi:hypothetical protein
VFKSMHNVNINVLFLCVKAIWRFAMVEDEILFLKAWVELMKSPLMRTQSFFASY